MASTSLNMFLATGSATGTVDGVEMVGPAVDPEGARIIARAALASITPKKIFQIRIGRLQLTNDTEYTK